MKKALQADPSWAGGDYETPPQAGLEAFATVYAGWALSQTWFRNNHHVEFAGSMAAFLDTITTMFCQFDANDLLGMLAAWQSADLGNHARFGGDLGKALGAITCRAIVMPSMTDLYFPPEDSALAVNLMPHAELRVINSIYGHCAGEPGLAPPADNAFIDQALAELLRG